MDLEVARDPMQHCTICGVSGVHTTEEHDKARANTCPGLTRDIVERMTIAELSRHLSPVKCPGCTLCKELV